MLNSNTKKVLDIPQDTEAEQAVLGAIIFDNLLFDEVSAFLEPKSFHFEAHQHVFRAMLELVEENQPIDEILLADQLKSFGKLEEIGGMLYLAELVECCPTQGNIVFYAKIIEEHALLREVITISNQISRKSRDPQQNIEELLQEAEEKLTNIARSQPNQGTDLKDALGIAFQKLEKTSENKSDITGIPTGFVDIDKLLSGLQDSDLIILAARPSMGKTALALNIANHAAKKDKNNQKDGIILIFSLEMSMEQLAMRMIISDSKIDSKKIKSGNLEQEDWDKLAMSTDRLSELPIKIIDETRISASQLESIIAYYDKTYDGGVKLVIVDYLQLMEEKAQSREQEIAKISRRFKAIAKKYNFPFIALSQLNRALENRADKHPQLSDLRESGSIEQDADIILFIYRDEVYDENSDKKGIAEINIAKHRNGPIGTINLAFIGKYTKFANLAKDNLPKSRV